MKLSHLHVLAAAILLSPASPAAQQRVAPAQPTNAQLEERFKRLEADLAYQKQKLAAAEAKADGTRQKAEAVTSAPTQNEKGWLVSHALTVQASAAIAGVALTLVLAVTTVVYAFTTQGILKESQKARLAAEQQAAAANEHLDLLKKNYEERLGLGPQKVREAIRDAKGLIVYWREQAARVQYPPHGNPDPSPLENSSLLDAIPHARHVSDELVQLMQWAHNALRNAKSELEKDYRTARQQSFGLKGNAVPYLEQADGLLNKASALLPQAGHQNTAQASTTVDSKPT